MYMHNTLSRLMGISALKTVFRNIENSLRNLRSFFQNYLARVGRNCSVYRAHCTVQTTVQYRLLCTVPLHSTDYCTVQYRLLCTVHTAQYTEVNIPISKNGHEDVHLNCKSEYIKATFAHVPTQRA